MTITIERHDGATYQPENARLGIRIATNVIDIPVPFEEEGAQVMSLGGKIRRLYVEWKIVGADLTDFQTKVNTALNFFITGEIGEKYTVTISHWNKSFTGVIREVSFEQREGEPLLIRARLEISLGDVIV